MQFMQIMQTTFSPLYITLLIYQVQKTAILLQSQTNNSASLMQKS